MRWIAERKAGQALYELMTVVGRYPALALPAARNRRHGTLLQDDTEILIEGYPRSGNSFAVAALARAQARPVRIAHHAHVPGHVIAAARAGVPALVVIREPAEAVVEFVLVKPVVTVAQALRGRSEERRVGKECRL